MTNKKLILLIHAGLLVFGLSSNKFSGHEFALLEFTLKYFSLPAIILSIVTTTFLSKKLEQRGNLENKVKLRPVERLIDIFGTIIICVLIGFSYLFGLKAFTEIANSHIGHQEIFTIDGQVIDKSVIVTTKYKTYYLKIQDFTDKTIEIRVSENEFEKYINGDTLKKNGKKGSLGFVYIE